MASDGTINSNSVWRTTTMFWSVIFGHFILWNGEPPITIKVTAEHNKLHSKTSLKQFAVDQYIQVLHTFHDASSYLTTITIFIARSAVISCQYNSNHFVDLNDPVVYPGSRHMLKRTLNWGMYHDYGDLRVNGI